jgi:CheY-like chemotaxis protein
MSVSGKILLVEDERILQLVHSKFLKSLGYQFELAASVQEAIALYQNNSNLIDLFILDLGLPEVAGSFINPEGGLIICKFVRAHECGQKRIPIVALTAAMEKGIRKKCFEVGFDSFANKPITREALEFKLKGLMASGSEKPPFFHQNNERVNNICTCSPK